MKEDQKLAIVKNWLDSQESPLLVFDNAPDMETIEKYLPSNGDIVVTSRNYKIPTAIEVDGMSEAEAIELLGNLVPKSNNKSEIAILVKQLGYLPLAIAQAGAYIDQNQITVDKYLELYKEEQNVLLMSDVMPVSDKHLPVYITWNLTLREIREKDKTGKSIELLNLMSFCHFVDIPKSLLIEYLYEAINNKTEIEFNKITTFLRQYSLIKSTPDTLAIHHLVQDCVRANMSKEEKQAALKKAIETIKKIYPLENKESNDFELVKILLPQMESLLNHTKQQLNINTATLVICIADAYEELGDYYKSKFLLEKSLNIQEKSITLKEHNYSVRKHINLAFTLRHLGKAYCSLGNYPKAKAALEESLAIQKSYYGASKNIDLVFTIRWLGVALFYNSDYIKAKKLFEEALSIQENHYGTRNHINVSDTLKRLGRVYLYLGEYLKAKTLLEESIVIEDNYHNTRSPIEKAYTIRFLGMAHLFLGDYPKAKELLEKALTIQQNYYGTQKHIVISFIFIELSRMHLCLGEYQKAKVLLEEALVLQKNYYGSSKHIELTHIFIELAKVYTFLGEYSKGKTLLEKTLVIQKKYYNTNKHLEIAYSSMQLGLIYYELGNFENAKKLLTDVLEFQENYYQRNHPDIANTLTSLAKIEHATNNNKEALSLIIRAENILRKHPELNPEHVYIKNVNKLKQEILNSKK